MLKHGWKRLIDSLSIIVLKKHLSSHLQNLKEELKPSEVIVVLGFAENYPFIIQDAAHGYHWDNT